MDAREQQHILDRLHAAVDTKVDGATYRQHIERASRTSPRFLEALRHTSI